MAGNKYFEDISNNLSLKDKVYNAIKTQIIRGNLQPGQRLAEEEISKEMNISRAPIREALNKLEKEGFIKIFPRKGTIVSPITKNDIYNIWEMRKILEPYAAKKSINKFQKEELNSIENQISEVLSNPSDFARYMDSDLKLHELLYKYLTNHLLKDTLTMVKEHSLRLRYYAEKKSSTPEGVIIQNCKEHLEIVKALKAGEEEIVYNTVLMHVLNGAKRTMEALNEDII
ncbi:MAG: GntR family transcriptional regulator [Peptococcaceae bacterium]|nr:GntR family transcriptional regulator [Peptococcaceae bacterium]MDH7526049.1 GntR family transcriptional regulator [Peptococcaceae bacterium]